MKRSDQTDKIIGQSIGPKGSALYRLVSLLGRQTGRRTFLAIDTRTQQKVVVKLLLFGPDFTWDDLKLFEREAETLKALEHPAIPQYLNSFEVETLLGEGFALVQTYIEAKSLQDWVTGGYRFGEQELKIIAGALLTILQYLHSRYPAVVHRDIKPSNVLLSEQVGHAPGHVYLVDFGSVQATRRQGSTMTVVGTYGYMPPEQFGGRTAPTSDLYSLGATLIYLATGQHPADFAEESLEAAAAAHLNVSQPFIQWIRQIIVSNASQRTPSAAIAFHDLSSLQPSRGDRMRNSHKHQQQEIATQTDTSFTISSQHASGFLPVAENAFQVETTAQTFAVRFDRNRIQEKLKYLRPHTNATEASRARIVFSVALGILLIVLLLIVIASGAAAGTALLFSVFSIIIATVWAASDSGDRSNHEYTAVMTLTRSPEASIYLTVEVLQGIAGDETSQQKVWRSPTQFTNMPLRAVHILPDSAGFHAGFIFSGEQAVRHPSIRIAGSQRRLKSLLRHINQWDSSLVDFTRNASARKRLN